MSPSPEEYAAVHDRLKARVEPLLYEQATPRTLERLRHAFLVAVQEVADLWWLPQEARRIEIAITCTDGVAKPEITSISAELLRCLEEAGLA